MAKERLTLILNAIFGAGFATGIIWLRLHDFIMSYVSKNFYRTGAELWYSDYAVGLSVPTVAVLLIWWATMSIAENQEIFAEPAEPTEPTQSTP